MSGESEYKMTKREFMENVIAGKVTAEDIKYAQAEIAKMDKRNADRKARPTKAQVANAVFAEEVVKFLGEEPVLAGDIAKAGIEGIGNPQKATAVLKYLVKEDRAEQVEVKVKGKGKVKGYVAK